MADLLTLSELKTALNVDSTDTRKDALYNQALPWVSDVIRRYTGRDFGSATVTAERSFEYDGSGFVDIDDASAITAVKLVVPNSSDITLDSSQWYAAPALRDDVPVHYYIKIAAGILSTWSNDDFLRNVNASLYPATQTVKVTGTWGWPSVPGDVKLAAIWTIQEWTNRPSGEAMTSEAIEGYSRSWGSKTGGSSEAMAIPNRARDLLFAYVKQQV